MYTVVCKASEPKISKVNVLIRPSVYWIRSVLRTYQMRD